MSEPAARRSVLAASLWALTVLPPVAILVLILQLAVNVPFQDDWDIVTVLAKWHEGTSGFADFWQQHSEHRILFLRVLIWLLGIFTDYNVIVEMLVGFVFAAFAFPVLRALLYRSLKEHAPELIVPMTAVASLLLFSLMLHENWFSGSASLELFLLRFVSVIMIWTLVRWPGQRRGVAIAIVCAAVGMLTEAAGLALWITGGVALWITSEPGRRRNAMLIVWALVAVAMVSIYMRGLDWEPSDLQLGALHLLRLFAFIAACLGLPFAYGTGAALSATVGVAGCSALATSVILLYRSRPEVVRSLAPILLVAAQGLFSAVLIGIGRSGLEPKYAMASHYAFGSSQFWIATITVVAVAVTILGPSVTSTEPIRKVGMAIACALCVGFFNANVHGYREAYTSSRNLEMALAALYSDDGPTEDVARFLYPPDVPHLRRQIARLKALRLGPFAPSMGPQKPRLVARFEDSGESESRDGFLDGGDCYRTIGWAWDPKNPDASVRVDIWYRGTKLGSTVANWFRPDLLSGGIGNGQHAFIFMFPSMLEVGTGERIRVTYAGTTHSLRASPRIIMCE